MKKLAEDIYQWSVFSEEKQLDFNGLWLLARGTEGDVPVLIDPPPMDAAVIKEIEELGRPEHILLTNKDHRRHAPEARERFGAKLWVHERDASLLDCPSDHTFADNDLLVGALEVVPVSDAKSPGETALYWRERRLLILGDALIGKPPGSLSLLPAGKFSDPSLAHQGAARLAELDVETILLGDGVSILENGNDAIRAFVETAG